MIHHESRKNRNNRKLEGKDVMLVLAVYTYNYLYRKRNSYKMFLHTKCYAPQDQSQVCQQFRPQHLSVFMWNPSPQTALMKWKCSIERNEISSSGTICDIPHSEETLRSLCKWTSPLGLKFASSDINLLIWIRNLMLIAKCAYHTSVLHWR